MSIAAPAQNDPFRAIRRFAGAQLVFAMVCAILVLSRLKTATSADEAGFSLIVLAVSLALSAAALPLALLNSQAARYARLAFVFEYALLSYLLTAFGALSLKFLVMPLLEVGPSMLDALRSCLLTAFGALSSVMPLLEVGASMLVVRTAPQPDAHLTTLATCLLIWPLQFLRPWRSHWACAARLCVAGVIAAWVAPVGLLPTLGEMALWLLAFVLMIGVIRLCDAIWSGVAPKGMPDGVRLLENASKPIPEYEGRGNRTVGLALSGGGYRASLFALGALMYVRDAIFVAPGRRVAAVCSVSGGSVTNAVIAHSGGLEGQDGGAFDRAAGELLRHATGPGSMFRGLRARLYYVGLLFPTLAAFIGLAWFGLPHIPVAILGRAVCIVVVTIALIVAFELIVAAALELISVAVEKFRGWSKRQFQLIEGHFITRLVSRGSFLVLTAMLFGLADGVLAMPEWRHGLAVIAAVLAALGGCLYVWSLRGPHLERTIEAALRRVTSATGLSDMPCAPHHILCATEIQKGETAYFAHDAITIPSLGRFAPDPLPTARAVRASAAFPIFFPPVLLRGLLKRGVLRGLWDVDDPRVARRSNTPRDLVFVDGGVRDNLAVDWFERGHAPATDELVVVSAAANRISRGGFAALPGFSEVLALIRIIFLPYNMRERLRRRAAAKLLYAPAWKGKEGAAGAIAHIEDSPDDLPLHVLACSGELERKELERKEDRLVDQLPTISHPSLMRPMTAEERQWKRQSELKHALFLAGALPDWAVDQKLAADDLVRAAGDEHRRVLVERAYAALRHLEEVEKDLPPNELPELERLLEIANLYHARFGTSFLGFLPVRGAVHVSWFERTTRSAAVRTTFGALSLKEARNLLLHGYYLACCNLHVALGWPLLRLDASRLEALSAGKSAEVVAPNAT